MSNHGLAVTILPAILMVVVLGLTTSAVVTPDAQATVEESAEWCSDRGGQLVHVNAVVHGGLHCELPNGTSVHMHEVTTDEH